MGSAGGPGTEVPPDSRQPPALSDASPLAWSRSVAPWQPLFFPSQVPLDIFREKFFEGKRTDILGDLKEASPRKMCDECLSATFSNRSEKEPGKHRAEGEDPTGAGAVQGLRTPLQRVTPLCVDTPGSALSLTEVDATAGMKQSCKNVEKSPSLSTEGALSRHPDVSQGKRGSSFSRSFWGKWGCEHLCL